MAKLCYSPRARGNNTPEPTLTSAKAFLVALNDTSDEFLLEGVKIQIEYVILIN